MKKNKFKVMSIGENKVSAYDKNGERYFIPEVLRNIIKVGDFALAIEKEFDKSRERDANGVYLKNEDGTFKFIDKPFKRWDITVVGTVEEIAEAAGEERILDATIDAIVAQKVAAVGKKYATDNVKLDALVDSTL